MLTMDRQRWHIGRHIRLGLMVMALLGLVVVANAQDGTPTLEDGPTATSTPEPIPPTLTIWWPDDLYSPDNPDVINVLQAQTDAFAASTGVNIETRIKSSAEVGGLMATLRSADAVAPAALPQVTLLNRQDLVTAQRLGIIYSLEGRLSSGIIGSMENMLQLGQIGEELYGLPYMVQLEHVVYQPDSGLTEEDSWDYESWFGRDVPLVFPGRQTRGLNDVFYLQYLESGGSLLSDGTLTFNPASLTQTLSFYEQASDAGLIDGFVLNYTNPVDYLPNFLSGEIQSAVFDSKDYFRILEQIPDVGVAPIPTSTGDMVTLLDGWMWVLVTADAEQRQIVIDYVTEMMSAENQVQAAQALGMVPTRRTLLGQALPDGVDVTFYRALIENAQLPLSDNEGGTLARALQEAFASVVTLEQSADAAAEEVIEEETRSD
ncbi:MAG: extracellular solute-binding protein [Anaerolineae bacterium]|nr:extracellular solute-binding protein [Anaerolineae bacterium]